MESEVGVFDEAAEEREEAVARAGEGDGARRVVEVYQERIAARMEASRGRAKRYCQ